MSTLTAKKKLLTAEEFCRLPEPPDGSKQELVRGEVVTVMAAPSFIHGVVQLNVAMMLKVFAKANNLGRVTVERASLPKKTRTRCAARTWPTGASSGCRPTRPPDVYAGVAADLCGEVKSPSNTPAKTTKKIAEYFACGRAHGVDCRPRRAHGDRVP